MPQHSTIRNLVLLVAAFSIPCAAVRAQALQHSLEGEDLQDHFGYSVGGGRDFDLDGHDDLIVSAVYYLTQAGYVRVLSGRTGEVLYAIESEHLAAGFGSDVSSIDDVNDGRFLTLIFSGELDLASFESLRAVVAAHDGTAPEDAGVDPRTNSDMMTLSPVAFSDLSFCERGEMWRGSACKTISFDMEIEAATIVSKARIGIKNGVDGDKITLLVVDRSDILGSFAEAGIGAGGEIVVAKYHESRPVFHRSRCFPCEFAVDIATGLDVQPGLFMRLIYESHGRRHPYISATYTFFEEG